jgi:hypothetical protein
MISERYISKESGGETISLRVTVEDNGTTSIWGGFTTGPHVPAISIRLASADSKEFDDDTIWSLVEPILRDVAAPRGPAVKNGEDVRADVTLALKHAGVKVRTD